VRALADVTVPKPFALDALLGAVAVCLEAPEHGLCELVRRLQSLRDDVACEDERPE
jgi:hypothetical protein